jgi:predicted transcriptional regulator
VTLSGDSGGLVNGEPWSSESMAGKIRAVFYVDPDAKDKNELLETSLKKMEFDGEKFGSVAIISLAATWLPNGLIEMSLKKKQEQYPRTVYVRDLNKVLLKPWNLVDDDYNALIVGRDGTVLFKESGVLDQAKVDQFIKVLQENI